MNVNMCVCLPVKFDIWCDGGLWSNKGGWGVHTAMHVCVCVFTRKMKSGLLLLRETGDRLSDVDVSSELWEDGWRKVWPVSLVSYSCSSNSAHTDTHTHEVGKRAQKGSGKEMHLTFCSTNGCTTVTIQANSHTHTHYFLYVVQSRDLAQLLFCIISPLPVCDSPNFKVAFGLQLILLWSLTFPPL